MGPRRAPEQLPMGKPAPPVESSRKRGLHLPSAAELYVWLALKAVGRDWDLLSESPTSTCPAAATGPSPSWQVSTGLTRPGRRS